jgi:hypothetical protein
MEIKEKKGTYAGVRFTDDTRKYITQYISDNKIPNATPSAKLHVTLLYSRKFVPDYEPDKSYQPPMKAKPIGFDIWQSQPDDDGHKNNCLILKLDAPDLRERHKYLMDNHDATYDYDEYKPHVTLSYDVGDATVDSFPEFDQQLELVGEYNEDLNMGWAKDNT